VILTQYYLNCLSHGSYLIGDESSGQAVVVDPRRDIGEYLADAADAGLHIVGVINTHFHADFVAGHLELAQATGAWIGYGLNAQAQYAVRNFSHGEKISLGEVQLEILETPGHTWESISVLVREHPDDRVPYAVLTGDALFIGDVGRPDLAVSVGASTDELARALFASIHEVLMSLHDDVRVLPAHGAGSACGKNLSDELESTIGSERASNSSVQPMSEDEFVAMITNGQPAIPEYFPIDAVLNRSLREVRGAARELPSFDIRAVRAAVLAGARILDTRSPEEYALGHLAGSINVGIEGRFAETAGMVVKHDEDIVVIDGEGNGTEAGVRLGRIGFDQVLGHLNDPQAVFAELGDLLERSVRLTVAQLDRELIIGRATVLDVRNPGERDQGFIAGSLHIPLAELAARHGEVPSDRPVIVHCVGGWRSSVAASALRAWGHGEVSDLIGGYSAWADEHANVPA